jgi:hypothetical protein
MMHLITCEDEGLKKDIFAGMVAQVVARLCNGSDVLLSQLGHTGTTNALRCSRFSALEAVGLQ